jgi:hypothetical protein
VKEETKQHALPPMDDVCGAKEVHAMELLLDSADPIWLVVMPSLVPLMKLFLPLPEKLTLSETLASLEICELLPFLNATALLQHAVQHVATVQSV